jgi:hypothetical protein
MKAKSQVEQSVQGTNTKSPESALARVVRLQRQADSRKRESLDHRIRNNVPGATGIHGEYYGVPQRQGRARNKVFLGFLRGTGLAEVLGSRDRAQQL